MSIKLKSGFTFDYDNLFGEGKVTKADIEAFGEKLKEAHKAQDLAAIDAATAELNAVFQAASQEMYNAQAQAGGQPQDGGSSNSSKGGDEVTDVDFEEVK